MQLQTVRRNRSLLDAGGTFLELTYHSIVREVRTSTGTATLGFLSEFVAVLSMLVMLYVLFEVLGLRAFAIRGNYMLYLLTGIFLFLLHNKAVTKMKGAASPTSGMMLHQPMTTSIGMASRVLSQLYIQILTFGVVLFVAWQLSGGMVIHDAPGLMAPFLLAWLSGCAIGFMFRNLMPFAPKAVEVVSNLYRRANMIFSCKMVPANLMAMTGAISIEWFQWNPLFHCIDQARGAAFVNYFPKWSNLTYPLILSAVLILIGLMGDHYLRRKQSHSWSAR